MKKINIENKQISDKAIADGMSENTRTCYMDSANCYANDKNDVYSSTSFIIYAVNETIVIIFTARINTPKYRYLPPKRKAKAAGAK